METIDFFEEGSTLPSEIITKVSTTTTVPSIFTLLLTVILEVGFISPGLEITKLRQRSDMTCPRSPSWEATMLCLEPWSPYSSPVLSPRGTGQIKEGDPGSALAGRWMVQLKTGCTWQLPGSKEAREVREGCPGKVRVRKEQKWAPVKTLTAE